MAFDNDLLISCAHLDDEALLEGQPGWVSELHRILEIRVGQLLGHKPRIWRDPKLQGNDYFADTILAERIPQVAALLAVLSPRYVQSEWCVREVERFCQAEPARHAWHPDMSAYPSCRGGRSVVPRRWWPWRSPSAPSPSSAA